MAQRDVWIMKKAKSNGKKYYFNARTKQSSWKKPEIGIIVSEECSSSKTSKICKKSTPDNSPASTKSPPAIYKLADAQTLPAKSPKSESVAKYDTKNVPRQNRQKKLKGVTSQPLDVDSINNTSQYLNNCNKTASEPIKINANKTNRDKTAISNSHVNTIEKSLPASNSQPTKSLKHKAKLKNVAEDRMKLLRKEFHPDSENPNVKILHLENRDARGKEIISKFGNIPTASVKPERSKIITNEEAMDWETVVYEVNQTRILNKCLDSEISMNVFKKNNSNPYEISSECIINVVVDTNIFLSHLETVEKLINFETDAYQIVVILPWRVLCELDCMKKVTRKDSNNKSIDHLARKALNFLYENLMTSNRLTGQSLDEANNRIYPCVTPDDEILNCCLQFSLSSKSVILLSNDKNLCNKGLVNNVESYTHEKFVPGFYNKYASKKTTHSSTSLKNLVNSINHQNPAKIIAAETMTDSLKYYNDVLKPSSLYERIEKLLKDFLSIVLETELKSHYDDLWTKIIYIKPPWTLSEIIKCFTKHWIAVFSELFPKEAQKNFRDLQYFYPIRRKVSVSNLSDADIKSLVSSASELIKNLYTRPEYVDSATKCCKALNEVINKKNDDCLVDDIAFLVESLDKPVENVESTIILEDNISNTLTSIWNGFSSYCSQMAYNFGVSHCLDNVNTSTIPFHELMSQANSVANQLKSIIGAISRILVCFPISSYSPEYNILEAQQSVDSFYCILYETVLAMGQSGLSFEKETFATYCSYRRDVLEDGFNRFSMLHNLLEECSRKYLAT